MAVATIKIGDLLDFSSPLAASTAPGNARPQYIGTVHHRPTHFQSSHRVEHGNTTNQIPKRRIKVEERETPEEERCPNVVVCNGVICTPYRSQPEERREEMVGGSGFRDDSRFSIMAEGRGQSLKMEQAIQHKRERIEVSSPYSSPSLDTRTQSNLTTQQLLKKVFITRRLLALKKLALKNQAMAVNLESLLPRVFPEATTPLLVPSGTETESLFGDIFSSSSMYGKEGLSFLNMDADSMSFDPSLFKDPALQMGGDDLQFLDSVDTPYHSSPSGVYDTWTMPMPLPLTPSEDLQGRATPSAFPSYTPSPDSSHTPSPTVPLTPDSIVSPDSSTNAGEELEEVLSFFSGPEALPTVSQAPSISSPEACQATPITPSTICNDSSSSLYSSYASLLSGPNSPSPSPSSASCSSTSYSTPYVLSPCDTPIPSPLIQHSISPQDTIRDLLARSEDATKRKSSDGFDSEPSPKKTKTTRSRKRVSASLKKERKREQNKTAALRYRQKKKEEKMEFESQQAELEQKNDALKDTLRGLEAEVNYLKRLWAEVQQAKHVSMSGNVI